MKRKNHEEAVAVPKSVGIIMDGNGRWAKKHNLPRSLGHKKGAGVFRDVVFDCRDLGVEYLTVYAFSTENWKRSQEEIDAITNLLREYLDKAFGEFKDENIVVKFLGDYSAFPDDVVKRIQKLELDSAKNDGMHLNVALNYGGRDEIVHAFKGMYKDIKNGVLTEDSINEETVNGYLYTSGQPDPDIIIRPSGEQRLSNFMLWQAAYTEFWYDDVLWPDFSKKDLIRAFKDYSNRDRRYGGRSK